MGPTNCKRNSAAYTKFYIFNQRLVATFRFAQEKTAHVTMKNPPAGLKDFGSVYYI